MKPFRVEEVTVKDIRLWGCFRQDRCGFCKLIAALLSRQTIRGILRDPCRCWRARDGATRSLVPGSSFPVEFCELSKRVQMSKHLSHMVYFTLQDASASKVEELLAACAKYLSGHPGVVYYSAGTLNRDLARPVNDHGYDVVLNLVFESRAAHDAYQTEPRHLKFIEEQKPNWKQVRVFDSDLVS